MGTGDVLAQLLEHSHEKNKQKHVVELKEFKLDYSRVFTMFSVGVCFSGPVLHYWYKGLDRIVTTGSVKGQAVKKMMVDQLAFAPVVISCFMGIMGTIHGNTLQENKDHIKKNLFYALKANWTLWPAAQVINFALVPPNLRVLYVSVISVIWNMFLSHLGNLKDDGDK
eukprot:gene4146-5187_t